MASFPLDQLGKVRAHAAKGISWSKSAVIVKRIPFPKGAIPPHLVTYAETFAKTARDCKAKIVKGKGAETVRAMNACIRAALKRK